MEKNIPNLFVVGAPKCGTTSIYEYLKSHPEIFMSETKEINFFGNDLQWYNSNNRILNKDQYLQFFKKSNGYKVIGEASTIYIHSETACDEIYNFNPSSKIIIMVRNLVDLIISMHSQLLFTGSENEVSLATALKLEEARMRMDDLPPLIDIANKLFYVHNSRNLLNNIKRYYKIFGRQNVHLIVLDDLKSNPEIEYSKVLDFLGADNSYIPQFSIHNKGRGFRYDFLRKFIRKFSPILGRLRGKIISRPIGIMKLLEKINSKNVDNRVSSSTIDFLYSEIGNSIAELEKFINRDLKNWKS